MGSVLTDLGQLCPGTACAKYVCNAMKVHSKCLDCCEFDIETTEILDSEHSEEFEIHDWCHLKKT